MTPTPIEAAIEALAECQEIFELYVTLHKQKGPDGHLKAMANQAHADMVAETLELLRAIPQPSEARPDLVPGMMFCAKCNFSLSRMNLYVKDGTVGAGTSETEPCPNGCGPLWPMTWKQLCNEYEDRLVKELADKKQPSEITVTQEQYDKLIAMLDAPPKDIPALKKLLAEPGVLEAPRERSRALSWASKADAFEALANKAIAILQQHILPDSGLSDHDALSLLYSVFDGPEYRSALALSPPVDAGVDVSPVSFDLEALKQPPLISSIFLGDSLRGKITEAEAVQLVNAVIQAQWQIITGQAKPVESIDGDLISRNMIVKGGG